MKKAFLFLVEYAKQNNISFEDAARRYLQSNGVFQSAVKDYILRAGRIPNVGILEQARQAGTLILISSEDKLKEFLELEPGQIPTLYRKLNFYGFANEFPVVFVACLVLAGENIENINSPSSFTNWEPRKDLKKAKEALNQLGDWIKDTAGDIADVGKKIVFAPLRGPFLLLVRFNVFNLARRIDAAIAKDRQRMKNFWENEIGGDFVQLINTATTGKKESPILPGKSQTFGKNYSSLDPATLTASITAASPIVAAVTTVLAGIGVAIDKGLEIKDKGKDLVGGKPAPAPTPGATPPINPNDLPKDKPATPAAKNNTTMLLLVGAGLVAAYLIYKKKI